jgi:hypothetical protein
MYPLNVNYDIIKLYFTVNQLFEVHKNIKFLFVQISDLPK